MNNTEKDRLIIKLQKQLDYLKTFVMTDNGTFWFPDDDEFLWGCGVQKKNANTISQLKEENERLQMELDLSKNDIQALNNTWRKVCSALQSENNSLRKRK